MKPPITTKKAMYRLLERGALGNTVRMWPGLSALLASGYDGLVSMRSLQVSNPIRKYHVPFAEILETVRLLPPDMREHGIMFSEAPPDHERTIQGEIYRSNSGLFLRYTRDPQPMRLAFDVEDLSECGIRADHLLRRELWPDDYEALFELLDIYDGHVVEFSVFRVPVGKIKGRRMIIWEVRRY